MNNQHTPAWANRAAIAIVNSVDANPAMNFEAKNSTAANIARIIADNDPTSDTLATLEDLVNFWDELLENAPQGIPSADVEIHLSPNNQRALLAMLRNGRAAIKKVTK